jgi:hypothetical protein
MYRPKLVPRPHTKPRVVSRPTAAALLGDISTKTVDRLVQRGLLRAVYVGARVMIDHDSIGDLIDGDRAKAG